ncbi:MAG: response regulator [Ideonella sp. WA131b]|jgi:signal transduction histidine kinase|nr:response regulator [Ideonella sp. WA131b]
MSTPVRLLHLEDAELDHALVVAHLRRGGLSLQERRVDTPKEFAQALRSPWDLVISDYHLPGFSGLDALRLLRAHEARHGTGPVPFILVSGQIGEDTAVEAMRHGASDYLLKNNLSRLVMAADSALAAAASHRARQQADRELAESRRQLSALAQHLQTSVEAERSAIAREIHDDVGGTLTALKFELDWIRRHAAEPIIKQRAASALETVTHAIEASQRIMQNLRPTILEQGLVAALQWLTQRFEARTGIACRLQLPDAASGPMPSLPAGVPLAAYRTVQEALTNVGKHAAATQVVVDLALTGCVLSLEISDNGRGLASADLGKARSFGIRGLRERAATVGGWIDLSSGAGHGTSLILSVPLDGGLLPPRPPAVLDSEEAEWTTY